MENEHKVNVSTMNGPLVGPLDQREHARGSNDLMTRRLKNRERQRRYRARKRLETDMKKACIPNQSTPPQLQLQGVPNACVARVHSQRDWKKDARRAHVLKEEVKSNGPLTSDPTSASGSKVLCLPSGVHATPPLESPLESEIQTRNSSVLDNSETQRNTPSRRHWKAEARNKKN